MSTATVTPPPATSGAPAAPPRMTAEEFGLRYSGQHVEYVKGQVKELPMAGGKHGVVCNLIAFFLTQHVRATSAGRVFSNDTFLKTSVREDPERVYGPDVFFVGFDRLPQEAEVPTGTVTAVPQLVVEVRSPFDTWAYVFGKVGAYLEAGVTAVVVIDFGTRTASVYRNDPANPQQILQAADALTLPDILPGLSVPVAALFE